ncbi:MAG: hypothetical protein ACO3EZ_01510 [Prochlorotrichaceae cyanobacterium]
MILLLALNPRQSKTLKFFQCLTCLNILNPRSWLMGLVWYFPLFYYLFDRFDPKLKIFLFLPLFLPPSLELNAYFSVAVALLSTVDPKQNVTAARNLDQALS